MAEHDVFESRLRVALLRHVADGPTEFDALGFARTVAAKEPRRHGFATALGLRGLAIPRLAWALLLLAGLLAAMVGGALLVGSQLQPKLPAVVPIGPAFACPPGSTPDKPGPVDQARPPRDVLEAMAFDRGSGRIVLLGTQTWTFDVCTNTWTQMHPSREPDYAAAWGPIVYDLASDMTVASWRSSPVWAYDLEADSWVEKAVSPAGATLLFYDPVSGHVVARHDAGDVWDWELWDYEVDTDTWTPIRQAARPATLKYRRHVDLFTYDASVDRLVAYTNRVSLGARTFLFDIRTGTWSETAWSATGAPTPGFGSGFGGYGKPSIAYDEAAKRTVISGGDAGLAAYDATADRWEVLVEGGAGPAPSSSWVSIVYDPVNERLVGRGLYERSRPDGTLVQVDDVVAFDLVTREWTVLLEPGQGQPAP